MLIATWAHRLRCEKEPLYILGWPSEKEDSGAPVPLTVVLKREFQQVSFVYLENLVKLPVPHHT